MEHKLALLQTILDALPINVFWKNQYGIYLGANKACMKAFSWLPGGITDVTGLTIFDLFNSPYAQAIENVDSHVIQTGEIFRGIERGVDKYGNGNAYFSIKQPMREGDTIIGMIGCAIEVTPCKTTLKAENANELLTALFMGTTDPVRHLTAIHCRLPTGPSKKCD